MPENEISNSVKVFLVFMLFLYIKASFGLFSQFSSEHPKNQIIDKRIYAILKLSDLKSDCTLTFGYLTQLWTTRPWMVRTSVILLLVIFMHSRWNSQKIGDISRSSRIGSLGHTHCLRPIFQRSRTHSNSPYCLP